MGSLTTRFRSLWILGGGLAIVAGIAAFALEAAIRPGHPCTTGAPRHGVLYFVLFIAFALVPGVVVGTVARVSGRGGEDTVGPFVLALCLSVVFVFGGLLAGWGGHGCIT
ncbi:MAG TPA: hypothetical protein VFN48_11140 [Solirubrobacteraceae bacterium]|nr:hypothetical protein [Solirubrobacteraceae bacterium]